jgi:cytochrome P450
MLRRYTFTVAMRRLTKDTEIAGQLLKSGEIVIVYMPAADLDPTEFDNPDLFDARREHKTHMAFGAGPHRCLGSHLARIELQALYSVVLKRLPEFRLDREKPIVFHAGMMLSVASLPIRWD